MDEDLDEAVDEAERLRAECLDVEEVTVVVESTEGD
jgi:hypothetical protein